MTVLPQSSPRAAGRARDPLTTDDVAAAMAAADVDAPVPELVAEATTTRAALVARGAQTLPHLSAVVAESTTAPFLEGHDPQHASPGTTVWMSVLLRADALAHGRTGWLPLAASLAVADAVRAAAKVPAETQWPDEVAVPGAMCGGAAGPRHLARVRVDPAVDGAADPVGDDTTGPVDVDAAVVVTLAVAVDTDPLALPAGATSVLLDGGRTDRAPLVAALLAHLAERHRQWREADPALAADYRERCRTIGRLTQADGASGWVSGIDEDGALAVALDG